jgi:DNA-binding transcriptional MerR regulator
MEYRVEALAAASGVRVDTIRFYQARGLLPAPRRMGRHALYDDDHLARLRRIRSLQRQGFSLAQIQQVLARPQAGAQGPLLAALVEERVGARTLTREQLAAEAGVPDALIGAAVSAGLIEPLQVDGAERFTETDLELARAGLAILEQGFPLQTLLAHAVTHARNVQELCDAAIDLFDDHVRKTGPAADDPAAITGVFRALLPQVTRLVALHFQRSLLTRALGRLEGRSQRDDLEAALAATGSAQLDVAVTWR